MGRKKMTKSTEPMRADLWTKKSCSFTFEGERSFSMKVMDLLDPGWPSFMGRIQRRELMLEVFGVAEMDLSQKQAKLSPALGHARDQEKHSFQSDVSIKVRGCFDSMHI